jgi:PAS domain S-box-containing protein
MQEPKFSVTFEYEIGDSTNLVNLSGNPELSLGYSESDFLSGTIDLFDKVHNDDSDIVQDFLSLSLTDSPLTTNLRIRNASGKITCFKVIYEKHLEDNSTVLKLNLLKATLLNRTMEEATSMVNFKAIMENTDDYIYFKDRNHVFTGASQTLVSLCDPAEHWSDLLGKTDYDVFPEEYADIYYRLEKQVFSGSPVAHEVQETLTKSGVKGWVDNRKYPIRDSSNEIIGLFGIARDITEEILAKQDLETALRQIESLRQREKENVYRATVSGTQHILNNLLNQLSLVRIEIDKHPDFDKDVSIAFDKIKNEAKKLVDKLSSVEEIDEENIKKSVYPE